MANQSNRGAHVRYDLELSLEDAATGTVAPVNIPRLIKCDQCDGKGKLTYLRSCDKCRGQRRFPQEKTLNVNIPPGIETGTRLRINGMGEDSLKGGKAGDLYIVAHLAEHERFERQGSNLYSAVDATNEQRALGLEIDVQTLIDGPRRLKLPARTKIGTVFRLKGHGMPLLGSDERGDLYISVTEADEYAADAAPAETKPALRVFLCHSSGDKPAVRSLYQRLRADGVIPWLDEEDLLPGQKWGK